MSSYHLMNINDLDAMAMHRTPSHLSDSTSGSPGFIRYLICIRKLPKIFKLFLSLPLSYLLSVNLRVWAIKNHCY